MSYNGYTNYETWCVALWISGDEGLYRYWRDQARRLDNNALRQALKDEFNEGTPIETANVYADLLQSALDAVNWDEVADSLKDE